MNKDKKQPSKSFFQLGELFGYFFRKRPDGDKADFSLRSMHFVNKLSMAIFILAILYLIIKHLF